MISKDELSESAVVDLARERVRLQSRGVKQSAPSHKKELAEISLLLDKGHSAEAQTRLTSLLPAIQKDPMTLAEARLALSVALEMQGDYRESLVAVTMYEEPESRSGLPADLALRLRVQLSVAYNYAGNHPKAIGLLQQALREISEQDPVLAAPVFVALARVYRSINEYPIARDYAERALAGYRQSGDWRGLAEAYFGLAFTDKHEGDHESALRNFEQALQLIGDHPATYFLGKIYANMAGVCHFLKRPQEGIRYLERAIDYYENTEHSVLAAMAHNNLGANLMMTGQWDRAEESFQRSLALLRSADERQENIPMALDSLGELELLRGNFADAHHHLEQAVAMAGELGNKWYECQAVRTLARCLIAMDSYAEALMTAQRAGELAERIGDRQATHESQLLIAESALKSGDLEYCESNLQPVAAHTNDSAADLGLAGEAQRLLGLLALARSDASSAMQNFGRCASIFDLVGDRYRSARAHFDLGRAAAIAQPDIAAEHLTRAINAFRELGARVDLERAEAALRDHEQTPPQQARRQDAAIQLITMRLAEAVASRALLLRELAAVIRQETGALRVAVLEPDEEQKYRPIVTHGYEPDEVARLIDELAAASEPAALKRFENKHDATIITLKSANSLPATVLVSPREHAQMPKGLSLDPMLRIVELGMDVCALRARASAGQTAEQQDGSVGTNLMPGFIHSSPAMTRLVEEVNKIRSSDVTVLVTGESGTGKELVARAIHALSSRREKIFVPFNCTAVPKELSESYLFGHKRGAFTGAVSDSVGVIRSASGGTLFIDEIGDLPLDVQPKLLRFLQEGEIQPLGEQQPVHIDVRIIAATNTDLEELVAQGRFREDLYYRLNVIRLRVPPLRERRSEIPSIVSYYVNHYSSKFGRHDIQILPQAVDLLMVGEWPGNVRQLCNEVQRIIARAENGTVITPDHLSPELRQVGVPTAPHGSASKFASGRTEVVSIENVTLADALEKVERRMITDALRKHRGNISRAARELGLTRRGLYLKLERYQINEDWRAESAQG